jgi:alpha-ketoglutaric semialdehyde dehydrogenase
MNGYNIIAGCNVHTGGTAFHAIDPATGEWPEGVFEPATPAVVEEAMQAAVSALQVYKKTDPLQKAAFLRAIAAELEADKEALIVRAVTESGLPVARITGELGRTTGQLNLFASLVEEGSWVEAVIDTAQPDRQPLPKPDIRRMLVALGPVVVFGASNFPLAFSVAGGDTASALAAGCPVVVKAHPAHPGTSLLAGQAICRAAEKTGMPAGVFSLLFDAGHEAGAALVQHAHTAAVAFTGSYKGGMALLQLAAARPKPIPVFTEMGSINPVVLLPQALEEQAEQLAARYAASVTLGAGQFCTNPGLLLGIRSAGLDRFAGSLATAIAAVPSATMLTPGICAQYQQHSEQLLAVKEVSLLARSGVAGQASANQAAATVARVPAAVFLQNPQLQQEVFGPWSLLVEADSLAQLKQVITQLEGQLTTTVMAAPGEAEQYPELLEALTDIAGRVILNGVPTGVEVCAAMQHGGPFPATSDSRFTSVGTAAVYRFVRPVAWQDWEDHLLPRELQRANPLNIWRKTDQQLSKA